MDVVSDFISYSLPWWIWSIPSVAILITVYFAAARYLGFKNALYGGIAALLAILGLLARSKWKQDGWRDRGRHDARNAEKVRLRSERARGRVRRDPKRLRDDDGFRRD
jgi:hypothetical protein